MNDNNKTKQQLIRELAAMRQQVAQIEALEARRRQRDDVLRENESRYGKIAKYTPDLIWTMDLSGRITYVNNAVKRIHGWTIDECLNLTIQDLVSPQQAALYTAIIEEELKKATEPQYDRNTIHSFESEDLRKDGSTFLAEITATFLWSDDGKPVGIIGITRDITESRRMAAALRQSEEKYRLIAENSGELITVTDMNLRFTYISPSITRTHGYTVEEAMNMAVEDFVTPGSMQTLLKVLEEELNLEAAGNSDPRRVRVLEVEEYKKDGTVIWLESSISGLRGKDNNIVGILTVNRDITKRKQAQEASRKAEQRLTDVINFLPDATFVIDASKRVQMWNLAMEELTGVRADAILGRTDYEYSIPFYGGKRPMLVDLLAEEPRNIEKYYPGHKRQGDSIIAEFFAPAVKNEGAYIWGIAKPLYDDGGHMTGAIESLRITTERRNAEDLIHRQKKEIEASALTMAATLRKLETANQEYGHANARLEEAQRQMTATNAKLRQSEEKFSKAFHLGPVIITISTLADGKYVEVSDYFVRLTGYTKDEIIGHTALDLGIWAYQEDREKVTRILESGGRVVEEELLFQSKSRKLYKMIFSAERVLIDETPHLVSVAIDITERRQVEEALRQSEGRYRTIIEQMEDGYFESDLAGNFTFVNEAESRILGYSRDELIGMNNRQYQDEANVDKLYQLFRQVYTTGEPIRSLDVEIIRKNGTKGFHEVSVSLIRNAEGRPIGFRGISRDVTDRRRAEEEKRSLEDRLNRAEKMEVLGRLAGGVAHDLNNILGALSGYSELLLMEIPEKQKARGHVEKIMRSTEKGAAIIQDLLTLARRGVTTSDVINLNQVVSGFLKTPVFENIRANHPLVIFKTDCQEELLNIKGSPVHLEKTLMNLVSNAAESIAGNGEVTIQTENRYLDSAVRGYDEVKEGDYVILIVSDTGMGIPAENREKIFEPFYTRKTMGRSGTGLGLAIVWGTVKDLNGYIDVQTEVGAGTAFTLYFPVTREELIAPQQKEPIERYMGSGESILVIDDIAEQRDVASGLLKKLGYQVHTVSSGEQAVEYLKDHKADILVLDMIMVPGMDGLETYQRILDINSQQKAILVSGFAETNRVREAQRLGAGAYVKKPYVMEKIGLAVRDELNR